jgi:hypothetical protein
VGPRVPSLLPLPLVEPESEPSKQSLRCIVGCTIGHVVVAVTRTLLLLASLASYSSTMRPCTTEMRRVPVPYRHREFIFSTHTASFQMSNDFTLR